MKSYKFISVLSLAILTGASISLIMNAEIGRKLQSNASTESTGTASEVSLTDNASEDLFDTVRMSRYALESAQNDLKEIGAIAPGQTKDSYRSTQEILGDKFGSR